MKSLKRACLLVSLEATVGGGGDDALALYDIIPASAADRPDVTAISRIEEDRLLSLLAETCVGEKGARNSLIFQLHVLEGYTAREISEMPQFGLSPANVETILRRTRARVIDLVGAKSD